MRCVGGDGHSPDKSNAGARSFLLVFGLDPCWWCGRNRDWHRLSRLAVDQMTAAFVSHGWWSWDDVQQIPSPVVSLESTQRPKLEILVHKID